MIQIGLAMRRTKYSKIRSIKYNLYYTIRGIVLLPIRLLLLPFKLIGKLTFYRKRKPNKTVLNIIFNKLRGTNERITSLNDIHSHRINKIVQQVDQNRTRYNLVMVHDSQLTQLEADFKRIDNRINEVELSLESMRPKDLGTFNFISDEPTQVELAQIEAELAGEKVVREEYDWTHEQKTQNELIQAKMRADEAEYDRLSEPDDDDNLIW